MSSSPQSSPKMDPSIVKRNRWYGVLIILIVMAPMALAYVMFQTGWGVSLSTTNKGQLLNPPISLLSLPQDTNTVTEIFSDDAEHKRWRLLVPVAENCTEICQKNLYTTRQVHVRLAQKAYRLERVILALDSFSDVTNAQLEQDHPNTLRLQTTRNTFEQWIATANVKQDAQDYYYLVDQEGNVMMRYDISHTGQDLLDDIKKLLKFTYDK